MDPQLAHAWPLIQAELRRAVSESAYDIWLAPLQPRELDGHLLCLEAPEALRGWIADRFERVLQTCAASVLGAEVTVTVLAAGAPAPHRHAAAGETAQAHAAPQLGREAGFNPKLTFEQFVIGDANRFAHAAALAVAELPGQAYNPLFLYGPPGTGKTHLLHSIANYLRAYGQGLTVRYATAETFTNGFTAALQAGDIDRFKQAFRGVDVLLVDDVQFLERKAKTEEEFFHTFNALHDAGSQLVLGSDRLPGDLGGLEERLRERFASGLVADLRAPDATTRLAILRKRAHVDGIAAGDEAALEVIAERITDNVRSLEGALIRVVAFHSLTGRPIDADLAGEVLDGLYPAPVRRRAPKPTVDQVQSLTCEAFGLSLEELVSADRSARVAWPRQVAMYLAREHTGESLPAIARRFGGRNHTTVMHACRRAAARVAEDAEARAAVHRLTALLCGEPEPLTAGDPPR